jgi:hypothetical protein
MKKNKNGLRISEIPLLLDCSTLYNMKVLAEVENSKISESLVSAEFWRIFRISQNLQNSIRFFNFRTPNS